MSLLRQRTSSLPRGAIILNEHALRSRLATDTLSIAEDALLRELLHRLITCSARVGG